MIEKHVIKKVRFSRGIIECVCGWTANVARNMQLIDCDEPIKEAWDAHRSKNGQHFDGHANTGSGGWQGESRATWERVELVRKLG